MEVMMYGEGTESSFPDLRGSFQTRNYSNSADHLRQSLVFLDFDSIPRLKLE